MELRLLRHATMVVRCAERCLLVDPMLGPPGQVPPIPDTPNPRRNPLVALPGGFERLVGELDAVVVTHLHSDHFDSTAAETLPKHLPILAQPEDEERLRERGFNEILPVEGSRPWRGIEFVRTAGRHGHGAMAERMAPVSGFVLRTPAEPALYIAGDTVWCDEVREVIETYEPDVIVVNAGAAQFLAGGPITMTAEDVAQVCDAAPEALVVAVHMEAMNHCLLTRAELGDFLAAKGLRDRVRTPADGESLRFPQI
jgi:L-ascorbate metabolism protein UlaG (beta-lactamase superfamily)